MTQKELAEILRALAALRVEAPDRPRGTGEPWHVGFNDALDEAAELLRERARDPRPRK